jgi:hypothetical protein
MTNAIRAFANVSELIDLQKIKESTQYKGFRLISESGELLRKR